MDPYQDGVLLCHWGISGLWFQTPERATFGVGQSQAGVKSVYLLETIGSVSMYAGF